LLMLEHYLLDKELMSGTIAHVGTGPCRGAKISLDDSTHYG